MKTTQAEIHFPIRAYRKTDLAMLYNPHYTRRTALRKLNVWIRQFPGLEESLLASGMRPQAREYSAYQVQLIVEHLGTP